jgi:iron complex outermembrane receptor protein
MTKKWSASYRYAHDVRDFNARWYFTDSPVDTSQEKVVRDLNQIQITRKNENSSTTISGSNINTTDVFNFNLKYAPLSVNKTTFSNIQAIHQFQFFENSKILFGAVANQRSIESNNRGNHDLMHYSLFSTLSAKVSESLTLNGGIRIEYEKVYSLQFLPQINAAFKLNTKCIIRASIGRSIRAADFTENYYNNYVPGTVVPGNRIGNPDLKPENSWNAELGADYNFMPGLDLSATGFGRFAQNMIDYLKTHGDSIWNNSNLNKSGYYFYATNNSKVNTVGVDIKISGHKEINKYSKLYFMAGYTFLNITSPENTSSLYYLLHSKHLVNGTGGIEYRFVDFNLNGLYKVRDSQTSKATSHILKGSYTVWNGNFDIALFKKNVFAIFTINNIFNEKYSDFLGAEMPGRWITIGAKMRL